MFPYIHTTKLKGCLLINFYGPILLTNIKQTLNYGKTKGIALKMHRKAIKTEAKPLDKNLSFFLISIFYFIIHSFNKLLY